MQRGHGPGGGCHPVHRYGVTPAAEVEEDIVFARHAAGVVLIAPPLMPAPACPPVRAQSRTTGRRALRSRSESLQCCRPR